MRIVYLKSAAADLLWLNHYYGSVFPEGKIRAKEQFRKVRAAIASNPCIGVEIDLGESVREFHVPKTPFSYLYRIKKDRIEIMRIFDNRGLRLQ
jgi:plasmid stabilization system protein ParE